MQKTMAAHYESLIREIGEDPGRPGLKDTPERAAKAFAYLTRGYHQSLDEVINNAIFESDNDEMVTVRNIEFHSLCEHHLLPFFGHCHIAYLPNSKVLGLSKFARIVDMFARRLQIQENLTQQIANAVASVTEARGVGVVMQARHMCMTMRGVEKQDPMMYSSVMLGAMRDSAATRQEFLTMVNVAK